MAYLIEENRMLRGQMRGRLRLTDDERRRLAARGHRFVVDLGRPSFRMAHRCSLDCRPTATDASRRGRAGQDVGDDENGTETETGKAPCPYLDLTCRGPGVLWLP
jgi:hypothetical protein